MLKVHLIKTPEYDEDSLKNVAELLQSVNGIMQFELHDFEFNTDAFPFLKKYWDDFRFPAFEGDKKMNEFKSELGYPLSWRELFSLCNHFRLLKKEEVHEKDFVTLLTKRKNALNWFSSCDENRNIFIHTGDWEYYIHTHHKYPVAYQIVENTLQHLMKIDINQLPNPYIHTESLGCMNDFCQNKQEIILKLRTGDICHTCLAKMNEEQIDEGIINQAIEIFDSIRKQLLFRQGFTRNLQQQKVYIDAQGKIIIGNNTIKLYPLEATLFIFFLTRSEGVRLNDLSQHHHELMEIYRAMRKSGAKEKIEQMVKPYHRSSTFSIYKSRLNKKLKAALGDALAQYYILDGTRGDEYTIAISREYVQLEMELKAQT